MSNITFNELIDVLSRTKFKRYFKHSKTKPTEFLECFRQAAEFVEQKPETQIISDPKDQPFIELASTLPAPEFLITGDKDFKEEKYHDVPVISAALFVKIVLD